jgi:peptidoglycan/xylan/chitin deacetylase (PgdA/CDA1 family)
MLKHRNIVVLFSLLLIALLVLDWTRDVPLIFYFLLLFIFLSIEFYGAAFISSNFHIKAICKADTQDKTVALTFDDGPSQKTEKVLEVLREFDTKATFFCIGKNIKGNETVLKKTDSEGHLVGNHSYSHDNLYDLKNTSYFIRDLSRANEEIKNCIGRDPHFFRPPYGVTTPDLARAVNKMNFEVIGWNIRSLDTVKDKNQVLTRIIDHLKPGSIILMHDAVSGIEIVLRELLIYLKNNNYKVVGLDTLIQKKAYV